MTLNTYAEDPPVGRRDPQVAEPKMSTKANRVHITLPETLNSKIEEIREQTDAASVAEVFRNAVIVYAKLLKEHKAGNEIAILPGNGGHPKVLQIFMD